MDWVNWRYNFADNLMAFQGLERLGAIFTHGCTGYFTCGAEIRIAPH